MTGMSNDLFDRIPKAQITKAKIDELDCIKLKIFCIAKETINIVKTTYKMKKNVCTPYIK